MDNQDVIVFCVLSTTDGCIHTIFLSRNWKVNQELCFCICRVTGCVVLRFYHSKGLAFMWTRRQENSFSSPQVSCLTSRLQFLYLEIRKVGLNNLEMCLSALRFYKYVAFCHLRSLLSWSSVESWCTDIMSQVPSFCSISLKLIKSLNYLAFQFTFVWLCALSILWSSVVEIPKIVLFLSRLCWNTA